MQKRSAIANLRRNRKFVVDWLTKYIFYSCRTATRNIACEQADKEVASLTKLNAASVKKKRLESGVVGKSFDDSWFSTVISLSSVAGRGDVDACSWSEAEEKAVKLVDEILEGTFGQQQLRLGLKEAKEVINPIVEAKSSPDVLTLMMVGKIAHQLGGLDKLREFFKQIEVLGGSERVLESVETLQELKGCL